MGDSDLSRGGSPPAGPESASLSDLLRAGDADAYAGFRDAHIGQVRAYCRVACPRELVGQACKAAFLDFIGRVSAADPDDGGLEAVLLAATRSAAAGRFPAPAVSDSEESPRGRRHAASSPETRVCAAMPELLAARANGELRGDGHVLAKHLATCSICADTEARLQAAEAAFSAASGWLTSTPQDPA